MLKFKKYREVPYDYFNVPVKYTKIKHHKNPNKQLELMEKLGSNYSACWINMKTGKAGIYFLLRCDEYGFIFKDKFYKYDSYGWVM